MIDRALTGREMAQLRALSSRALITSSSFVNTYNYGDFRGDPAALMERCASYSFGRPTSGNRACSSGWPKPGLQ